jgi:hypothetical protein
MLNINCDKTRFGKCLVNEYIIKEINDKSDQYTIDNINVNIDNNEEYYKNSFNDSYFITSNISKPSDIKGGKNVKYSENSESKTKALTNERMKLPPINSKLIRVSSTTNISIVKESCKPYYKSSVLFGGIKYNESLSEMKKESERYPNYSNSAVDNGLALRSISNRGTWGELNATKDEISGIKESLKKNGIATQTVTESFANEESFKALSGKSPDIIHLATHGYYISSRKKASVSSFLSQITPYSEKERYMQWSGLLMAGANNAWNGNFTLENVEDGILTADEISRLDLSKTQMVVLSACETAKGVIDPVDGVYGLQQAFKKAGAGTIVMSLWKVPDESTSLLMNSFYAALISGNEKHDSLKMAMLEVQKKYKDPYYWAGFIILD